LPDSIGLLGFSGEQLGQVGVAQGAGYFFFFPEALPPFRPPLREADLFDFFPRSEPLFFPPPLSLFTVAQARCSASFFETPRFS
jgi:hypothetical protein